MASGEFPKVGRVGVPIARARDDEDPEVAGVEEAIAEVDAGFYVPSEEVDAWIDSWGTPNEIPMPQPRRRPT